MALMPWNRHAPPIEMLGHPPRWRKMHSRRTMTRLLRTRDVVQVTAALVTAVTVGVLAWTEADLVRAEYSSINRAAIALTIISHAHALLDTPQRPQPPSLALAPPELDMVAAGAKGRSDAADSPLPPAANVPLPRTESASISSGLTATSASTSPTASGAVEAAPVSDVADSIAQPAAPAAVEQPAMPTVAPQTPAAPAQSRKPPAQPTAAPVTIYVVVPGDSLYSISLKFKTSVGEIATLNKISDPNTLAEGQKLQIPRPR